MSKEEKLIEILKNLDQIVLFYLWDDFCDLLCYYDDKIYQMDEFDELMSGRTPLEIVDSIDAAEFRTTDLYFIWTIYGAKSFDYLTDEYVDFEGLADYIIRKNIDFEVIEIKEFLKDGSDK